jgi:hypothetical protein
MAYRPTLYERSVRSQRGIGLSIDPWTMRPIEDVVPYRPENWVPGIGGGAGTGIGA